MELTNFVKKAAKLRRNSSNYESKHAPELTGIGQTFKNTELLASIESEFITSLLENEDKIITRTVERNRFPLEYESIDCEHGAFANGQMLNNDLVTSGLNLDLSQTNTCVYKSTDYNHLQLPTTNRVYSHTSFETKSIDDSIDKEANRNLSQIEIGCIYNQIIPVYPVSNPKSPTVIYDHSGSHATNISKSQPGKSKATAKVSINEKKSKFRPLQRISAPKITRCLSHPISSTTIQHATDIVFSVSYPMLSFLNHRVEDFQDLSAMECLGDWLSKGIIPPASEILLNLENIPSPPQSLIESPNLSLAVYYYSEANRQGSTSSGVKLAFLLHEHPELEYTESTKENLLEKAAKENDVFAIKTLAYWTHLASEEKVLNPDNEDEKATETPKKKRKLKQKVFKLWLQAANLGDATSIQAVSQCYQSGMGSQISQSKAVFWLEKASELGDSNALKQVAAVYRSKMLQGSYFHDDRKQPTHTQLVPNDDSEDETSREEDDVSEPSFEDVCRSSFEYTVKSAAENDPVSLICLGQAYSSLTGAWDPWGVDFDVKIGMDYYLKASDAGATGALLICAGLLYTLWEEEVRRIAKEANRRKKEEQQQKIAATIEKVDNSVIKKVATSRKVSTLKPKEVSAFAQQFSISQAHAQNLFDSIMTVLKENGMGQKIKMKLSGGGIEDVFRLFSKIDTVLGAETCLSESD